MGRFFCIFMSGSKVFVCASCGTHLTSGDHLVSKAFQAHHGKAYLFDYVVNTTVSEPENRMFNSGEYTVRDLHCMVCAQVIGWRYDASMQEDQKFKEGKFIIEKELMTKAA
eukprot:TRINITY_DN1117_c0_g1_i3.p2 TRINITY_DN1117_c0_g1~~TRINITY_DN1117_c0_g1_i3.p2  ORF type:complete len:111 (-),score=23.28 TRINITY_DN1117_c0_g1_i3:156-488(-)